MQNRTAIVAATALAALGASTAQAGLIIDTFNTTQTVEIAAGGANPAMNSDSVVTGLESIGGTRDIILQRTDGLQLLSTRVNINNGIFDFGAEPGVGGNVTIIYDAGMDGLLDPSGLDGADLTQGGIDDALCIAFRYDLVLEVTVTVYTDESQVSTRSFTFFGPSGFGGPFNEVLLPYASFVPILGGGADFANIGAIEIYAETSEDSLGADFQLDIIKTVPTPGALALMGLAGLASSRRRR